MNDKTDALLEVLEDMKNIVSVCYESNRGMDDIEDEVIAILREKSGFSEKKREVKYGPNNTGNSDEDVMHVSNTFYFNREHAYTPCSFDDLVKAQCALDFIKMSRTERPLLYKYMAIRFIRLIIQSDHERVKMPFNSDNDELIIRSIDFANDFKFADRHDYINACLNHDFYTTDLLNASPFNDNAAVVNINALLTMIGSIQRRMLSLNICCTDGEIVAFRIAPVYEPFSYSDQNTDKMDRRYSVTNGEVNKYLDEFVQKGYIQDEDKLKCLFSVLTMIGSSGNRLPFFPGSWEQLRDHLNQYIVNQKSDKELKDHVQLMPPEDPIMNDFISAIMMEAITLHQIRNGARCVEDKNIGSAVLHVRSDLKHYDDVYLFMNFDDGVNIPKDFINYNIKALAKNEDIHIIVLNENW